MVDNLEIQSYLLTRPGTTRIQMDVTLSARANFESSNYGRAEYGSQQAAESNNNRKNGELNELKTYFGLET